MAAGTTAQSAADKWSSRAGVAGTDYVNGAVAAAQDQATNAIAQAQSWLDGVNQAGINSFKAGVTAAQQSNKYASRIQAVGSSRFTSGVQAAKTLFATQIGKVLSAALAAIPGLTPKGPKGSPANAARSTEMQAALRKAKLAGQFK